MASITISNGLAAKMRSFCVFFFKINTICELINPPDDSRKCTENVENEPVTQQMRTAGTSDAEPMMRTYLA